MGVTSGPPEWSNEQQGYRSDQEHWDPNPEGESRGGYEPPLTAEEAEWEWQRQLAEQEDSQEQDVW